LACCSVEKLRVMLHSQVAGEKCAA